MHSCDPQKCFEYDSKQPIIIIDLPGSCRKFIYATKEETKKEEKKEGEEEDKPEIPPILKWVPMQSELPMKIELIV
jgi:hypothetical protein